MNDRYTYEYGLVMDGDKQMTRKELVGVLNELNAKANPEPEEVRVSLGWPETVKQLSEILNAFDDYIQIWADGGWMAKFSLVTKGCREWIEIAIPDAPEPKEIPYLYTDADDAFQKTDIPGIPWTFSAAFRAARKRKP